MRTACFWPWKSCYFQKRLIMCLSERLCTKHMSCAHTHLNISCKDYRTNRTAISILFSTLYLLQNMLCVYSQQIIQCYSSTATQYHRMLTGNKLQCFIKCLLGFHNGHGPISPLSSMCCSLKTLPSDMWLTLSHGEHSHISRGSTVAKLH